MAMKLILMEDVDKLGSRGEIVSVAPGYGRNFLIPQGKALLATADNIRQAESRKKKVEAVHAKERSEAEAIAAKIGRISVTIARKVGENETLYGSVTASDIHEALEKKGVSVDRRKIQLPDPIKTLGEVTVGIKIHPEVTAEVRVAVVPEA